MTPSRHSYLSDLAELAISRSAGMRPTLARVLTDLFVEADRPHTPEEVADFGELIGNLFGEIDAPARRIIAEKLCARSDLPVELMEHLAQSEAAVARPVVERCPLLGEAFLTRLIDRCGDEMRAAVARRAGLTGALLERLVATGSEPVLAALLANQTIRLPENAIPTLIRDATEMPSLATSLSVRRDVSGRAALPLFLSSSPEGRRRLLADLSPAGEPGQRQAASLLAGDIGRTLVEHAAYGRRQEITALIAAVLKVPSETASFIVDDPDGEPLIVALAALRLDEGSVLSLLILGNPEIGCSFAKVSSLYELAQSLDCRVADQVVAAWRAPERQEPALPRPAHQPQLVDTQPARAVPAAKGKLTKPARIARRDIA